MERRVALLLTAAVCASCGTFSPSTEDLRREPHGHLVWAARTGDVAAIRRLAATGIDLDASPVTAHTFVFPDLDHIRWTALQHAVQKHQVDAVRVLLEWGADPDATQAGTVNTALFIAAGDKDPTITRLLVEHARHGCRHGRDDHLGHGVMPGVVPGIHVFFPAMTARMIGSTGNRLEPGRDLPDIARGHGEAP